jgi:hypothetical protein
VQRDIQRERKYLVETYNDFFKQLGAITEKWDEWKHSTSELTRIARGQTGRCSQKRNICVRMLTRGITGYTAEATERIKLDMDLTDVRMSQSHHEMQQLENQVNELKQKLTEARARYTDKLGKKHSRWFPGSALT